MLHAEQNCLKYTRPGEGKLLAVTLIPCLSCLALMASYGIKEVYYQDEWEHFDPDIFIVAKEFGINLQKLCPQPNDHPVSTEKSSEK